jgi:hypothetical protein
MTITRRLNSCAGASTPICLRLQPLQAPHSRFEYFDPIWGVGSMNHLHLTVPACMLMTSRRWTAIRGSSS